MEGTTSWATSVVEWLGNLSLSAALFACLVLWGGVILVLKSPSYPPNPVPSASAGSAGTEDAPGHKPEDPATAVGRPPQRGDGERARAGLADLLLFWLPIGLGAIACCAGVATLAWGHTTYPVACRRALIALVLGIVPGCLCGFWYLVLAI
jgi:hypothetical protein